MLRKGVKQIFQGGHCTEYSPDQLVSQFQISIIKALLLVRALPCIRYKTEKSPGTLPGGTTVIS